MTQRYCYEIFIVALACAGDASADGSRLDFAEEGASLVNVISWANHDSPRFDAMS